MLHCKYEMRSKPLRTLLKSIALLLILPTTALPQSENQDALKFLDEVLAKYTSATTYHIEAIIESRRSSELSDYRSKHFLTAYAAPGNRYRFEARAPNGEGSVISDGTTEWEYHPIYAEYKTEPAGTYGHPFPKVPTTSDEVTEREAYFLRTNFGPIGSNLKSAHFLTPETIRIDGRSIPCIVIQFSSQDERKPDSSSKRTTTLWIEKKNHVIVKNLNVTDGHSPWAGDHPVPGARPFHSESTTIYPIVALDDPIADSVFTFSPPATAKLVTTLTDPSVIFSAYASQPHKMPNRIGTVLPDITLHALDGSPFSLSSLRGHPVLIDMWATWCGPCLMQMPSLDHIFNATKNTGLVVLGVDQDKNPKDAADYLHRKNFAWANYHADEKGLNLVYEGIPFNVLVDAEGKILYAHTGIDDEQGLEDAIRNLGPEFKASLDKP
jgi:thiol-disulfide isomerase/thioredoxin